MISAGRTNGRNKKRIRSVCSFRIKHGACPDYNLAIEYQGKQHYEPVDFAGKGDEWAKYQFKVGQQRDNIKRQYCQQNNIKLIEIPYWDYDNIDNIVKQIITLK